MALFLRGLFWLSVLGGAVAGIGLPTNNAVQSLLNKQKLREKGWGDQSGRDYESYWYGERGFGDSRTKKVTNGQWSQELKEALTKVRGEWGKSKLGEGLEKGFADWLKKKKYCDGNGSQDNGNGECNVGTIEFVDEKGKTLFGRIPIQDKSGVKSNIYVKWVKCTNTDKNLKKIGGVWFGSRRKDKGGNVSPRATSHSEIGHNQTRDFSWCSESLKSSTESR